MENFRLGVLLLYSTVLMGIGLWIGLRVRAVSDFFVAGRRLGTSIQSCQIRINLSRCPQYAKPQT